MSKIVKVILVVAVVAAVVVFAAPLIAPALTAAIGASAAAAVASAVVGMAISIGLTAVMSLFRKSPSVPPATTERLNAQLLPAAPRKIVFGRTAAAADLRFFETYGSKKDQYAQVIALASHRVHAIREWYLEEELVWNGGIVSHADGVKSFRAVTEGTSSNGQAVGSGSFWNSSATFTGCAYIAIHYSLDSKAWPQGIPNKMVTIVDGCPVYDPRLDSTNGGSGPHRISDQSTWSFMNGSVEIGRNPALCVLTYLIGWRINGKLAWGMGVPASSINFENFRAYANVCEEGVAVAGGGTVQRYTADGIVSTADTHESTIGALTAAMGSCKLTDTGGVYCLVGGYDDTLGPIQALGDDDIVGAIGSPTPYVWQPAGSLKDSYNVVRGRFADPASLYQIVDWGVIETDPLADDIPRYLQLDLPFVSRAETCQRIAKQFLLREAKASGVFTATFGPRAFAVQVGSLVKLSVRAQGWNGKLFRVQEQREVHDLFMQMTLREEYASIYAWDREEKPLPPSIRPGGYDATHIIPIQGFTLSTSTYTTT